MIGNEKWLVLVVALLMITVLVLLSSMAINTTTTDIKIANNYREGVKALYDAEAGIHYAIGLLKSSTIMLLTSLNVQTTPTPSITPPTGFSFSGTTLTNLGSNRYQISARGNAAVGGHPNPMQVGGTSLYTNETWSNFVDNIIANNLYVTATPGGSLGTWEYAANHPHRGRGRNPELNHREHARRRDPDHRWRRGIHPHRDFPF
jgi:hypothetical protein